MPLALSILLTLHILLVTLGYGGLIVANAWLAMSLRSSEQATALVTLRTAINVFRSFGPMLGIGMLLGFAIAGWLHVALTSAWLIAAYALIFCAMLLQGMVAVPWNVRTLRTLESTGANATSLAAIDARVPAAVAWGLTGTLVLLVLVMVWRPA